MDGDLSISSSGIVIEELNDKLEVISVKHFGFTEKKKLEAPNIVYYNRKDFKNDYARYKFMMDHILNWLKDCEYVAIENFAFGKTGSSGQIFNLAEFEGNVKLRLWEQGKKLRLYSVNSNKKFFSGYGLSDKIGMRDAFEKWKGVKPDLSALPEVLKGSGVQTTSDIIDAFALCEFLRKELRLRAGIDLLFEQDKTVIECFNSVTKECPEGLLVAPFLEM